MKIRPFAPSSSTIINRRAAILGGGAAIGAASMGVGVAQTGGSAPLVVGGKAFTEQYVLAEITRQLLVREGIAAETRVGFATDAIRQAQLSGDVDISWDYTWTGYAFHHGLSDPATADEVLAIVRDLDADSGLAWLSRSAVNNTYAFAVNLDFAAENCIHSIPELAQAIRNGLRLRLASDQECHRRIDCLLGAQEAYDFVMPGDLIDVMNVSQTVEMLRERRAEIAVVYTTDGKIPAYDLELLEDPERVFAEYFLVPVVREEALAREPRLRGLLESISLSLDTATSQNLHYRVEIVGQSVESVARYYIASRGI